MAKICLSLYSLGAFFIQQSLYLDKTHREAVKKSIFRRLKALWGDFYGCKPLIYGKTCKSCNLPFYEPFYDRKITVKRS